jgi:hypothetical protein
MGAESTRSRQRSASAALIMTSRPGVCDRTCRSDDKEMSAAVHPAGALRLFFYRPASKGGQASIAPQGQLSREGR